MCKSIVTYPEVSFEFSIFYPMSSVLKYVVEPASGDRKHIIHWELGWTGDLVYQTFERETQIPTTESRELPNWGNWYWATRDRAGVSAC